jgi:hypothetical protein
MKRNAFMKEGANQSLDEVLNVSFYKLNNIGIWSSSFR